MDISTALRRSLLWILVLAAGTACWGQEVLLELKYEKGETRQYRILLEIELSGDLIPAGRKIEESRTVKWEIQKVHDNGSADVLVTQSDISYKEDGEEIPLAANDGLSVAGLPVDVPLLFTFSANGNVKDIKPTKELRPSQKAKAESFFDTLKNMKEVWPEKPVKPGHTWEDTIIVSAELGGQINLDISADLIYTFEGIETHGGVSCAKIKAAGSGSGVLGDGMGTVETKSATITFIDLEKGRIVEVDEQNDTTFTIITEKGEGILRNTYKQTMTLIP